MLNYSIAEELVKRMRGISSMTECLTTISGSYYNMVLKYLESLQKFSDSNNLYISADIALASEKLLTFKAPTDQTSTMRSNPRKDKDAYAVKILETLFVELKSFLEKDRKTFDECEDIWRQVLARLLSRGVDENSFPTDSFEKLDFIIELVKQDKELFPYYSHILGLMGSANAKMMLDITLPQLGL